MTVKVKVLAKGEADQSEKELIRERMKNSKYQRRDFPDWLNRLSDDDLDRYFIANPGSKYNPAKDPEVKKKKDDQKKQDEKHDKHTLPLMQRLTFKGWLKSAPTKDVRKRLRDTKEAKDDFILDKEDLAERLDGLREAQKEDRELKSDTESPRRKKRLEKRIIKRGDKINIIRNRLDKIKSRINTCTKRIDLLHKEMRNRT